MKKKGLVKTVQVNPFNLTKMCPLKRIMDYRLWLFSINRTSWHSVTRLRLVYQTTYQRFSQKILPWLSKATKFPPIMMLLREQLETVQKSSKCGAAPHLFIVDVMCVWQRELLLENSVKRRQLVIGASPGYSQVALSGLRTDECSFISYHSHMVKGSEVL